MMVGDSAFNLHGAVIIENMGTRTTGTFHETTDGFLYLVHLVDSRMILNSDTTLISPRGVRVPYITIPCYSHNPDFLPSGSYNFSNSQPHPKFSFSGGVVYYLHWDDGFANVNLSYLKPINGTLIIEHICEDSYNISLNATLDNDGLFQGSVSAKIFRTDSR